MLTGRYEAIPQEGEIATPTPWHSMADSFKASYQTPYLINPSLSTGDRQDLHDSVNALEHVANMGDQGLMQRTGNWFAGFVGGALNPYSLIAGEGLGAATSKAISSGAGLIGRYAPVTATAVARGVAQKRLGSMIGENVPDFVRNATIGGVAKGGVTGFSAGTGFSLPQELATTYNPSNDSFNWWGGVKASFADGGIGLGLMAVPFLAGTLWGKMFKGTVPHSEMPLPHEAKGSDTHPALAKIDEAVANGNMSEHEGNFFRDYLTGADTNENLSTRAIGLLIKDGHPVDAATKRVLYKLFSPEDVGNLQTALADSLASALPENVKKLLPKFMIDTKVDELRGNTKMLDGIEGVVSFMKKRLSLKPDEIVNANKMLRKLLPTEIKEDNSLTQYKVYRLAKSGNAEGLTIPHQVNRRLSNEKELFRGSRFNPEVHDFNKFKPRFDYHFGEGYWFAELEAHAKHYGKYVQKIVGEYNLYDSIKGGDKKADDLLSKIKRSPSHLFDSKRGKFTNSIINALNRNNRVNLVKKLHKYLKKKGYEGIIRREGAADSFGKRTPVEGVEGPKTEIMFFEKPKSKINKLLSHSKEIKYLRNELMPNGKVREDFKSTDSYHRLLDLTNVKNDARALMHEVHLAHEYEMHEHYATFLDAMTKVMRANVGKLADHNSVLAYMKDRLIRHIPDLDNIERIDTKVENRIERVKQKEAREDGVKMENEKAFKDDVIDSYDHDMHDATGEIKEEYEAVKNQFKEFNEKQPVFKNLVKCVLGAMNG